MFIPLGVNWIEPAGPVEPRQRLQWMATQGQEITHLVDTVGIAGIELKGMA